jgi:hypothetical protein
MKHIILMATFLALGQLLWCQAESGDKAGDLNEGEFSLTGSAGLIFPSTSNAWNSKNGAGIGLLIGGKYHFTENANLYGNLGYNRIFKNGYRQSSVLLYVGGSYYPFKQPFSIGGEVGLNFFKERTIGTDYNYYYGYYYSYWYSTVGVSWYLAGVLGYEIVLPFGRISLNGRLGLTYRGLFIAGNVGLILPVLN